MSRFLKPILCILIVGLAISAFFNLEHSRSRAILEARHTASIRVLCEFHANFFKQPGVKGEDYKAALLEFGQKNRSLDSIQQFVECVRGQQ